LNRGNSRENLREHGLLVNAGLVVQTMFLFLVAAAHGSGRAQWEMPG
jgi:hypothetical protein